jgi:sugar phosphate isomerase/epimerase
VHLGDTNRLLPGRGHLDWDGVFAALRDLGYDGYVNLECSTSGDPAETLPAAGAFLRSLIGAGTS